MATLHGLGGMVYLQGSGSAAIKLGEARTWRINVDAAMDEDNALGDSWRTQLKGLQSWSGSMEGNVDTASTLAWDAGTNTAVRKMYFYHTGSATTQYYYGTVWPKLSIEAGIAAVARFTLDFDGDGQLAAN